jgi:NAD(P)-dependent dehydrogenase (short-subunit alcohol dehydrogenase family)
MESAGQLNFSEDTQAASWALVVGASRGIGLGLVQRLLSDHPTNWVCATYRRPETAQALLALADRHPRLVALPMEVTDEDSIAAAIAQVAAHTAQLHRAIYCVGVLHDGDFQPEKSLRQVTSAGLMRAFQTNALGAVLVAKHLMPLYQHDRPSLLAAISAKVGSIGDNRLGGWYGYRASKAALNMLIKTVSLEYARRCPNTTVALLHPGTTATDLSAPFQRGVPPEKLFSVDRTVDQLLTVMQGLTPADSGEFFNWDGTRLPW